MRLRAVLSVIGVALAFALAAAADTQSNAVQNKVVFIFNFFEELRRIAPVTKR